MQESSTLRTNRVAAIRTTVGSSGVLKIFSGAKPANCAAADPSGLLATITLPATPLSESGGVSSLLGTWSATASASGYSQSWRVYDGSSNCHMQGVVSEAWAQSHAYAVGQQASNANGVYVCTTGGTSSSSGIGPSGTGTGISDGSVVWNYVQAAAELVIGSTNITSGQTVTVTSFSTTAGNS